MKCTDVRKTLTAFLDHEATLLEQKQIRDHIAGCADCRTELATLSKLQSHLHRALKIEAAQVAPPAEAWRRLQARLANEPVSPPAHGNRLLHRLALLGSNHQEVDRKNRPTSDTSQGWSPAADLVTKQWWHQGLVLAAKWSRKSIGGPSRKPFTVSNRQTKDGKPDGSA
jgi:anti-sigma factor RsiW